MPGDQMNDDERKTIRVPTPDGDKEVLVPTREEMHGIAQGADVSSYRDRYTEEDVAERLRLGIEEARRGERTRGVSPEAIQRGAKKVRNEH